MISKFKRLGLATVGAAMIFSLAACGGNNSDGQSSGGGKNGKVELSLWEAWSGNTSDTKIYNNRVKAFNKSHPKIHVTTQMTDSDNYRTKLKTRAAGKQLPDIFQVWPGSELSPIVKGGHMQSVDAVTDPMKGKMIPESVLQDYAVDGKQYAIPAQVAYTNMVFYDEDMLKKEGYDSFPKTYTKFVSLIKKLKADGITPIQLGNKAQWPLQSIYISMIADRIVGSDFPSDALNGKEKFTNPKFVKAISVIKSLNDMGAFNQDANTITDDEALSNFVQGKSAIFISGSWSTTGLLDEKSKGKHIRTAIFPKFSGEQGDPDKVSGVAGMGLGLNSNLSGDKKKAAMTFLKYFYSQGLYNDLLDSGLLIAAKGDVPKDSDQLFKDAYNITRGGTASVYDGVLPADITSTLNNGLQGLLSGSSTPKGIAQQMQDEVSQ